MNKKITRLLIFIIFLISNLIPLSSAYVDNNISSNENSAISNNYHDLPEYFSWKDNSGYDWTTPAKNQLYPKSCGSCWAFAPIGAMESCIKIARNTPDVDIDLSEQYLLSCIPILAFNYGNGCNGGGNMWRVFHYIQDNSSDGNYCNGIIPEECFPYQADDDIPCEEKCLDWESHLIQIYGYDTINELGENYRDDLKTAIMEFGPIAVGMENSFDYIEWIWSNHDQNDYYPYDEDEKLYGGHGVSIVGWKDDQSIGNGGYWIIKNSVGPLAGYDGFMNIEYDALGICEGGASLVSVGIPDLECIGTISAIDINPGDTITGNFTVENIGQHGSILRWNIVEIPEWGEWTIKPKIFNFRSLTPYEGTETVTVTIEIPMEQNQDFNGQIKIVNTNNENDYEIIDVSISTSKKLEDNYSIFDSFINHIIDFFLHLF